MAERPGNGGTGGNGGAPGNGGTGGNDGAPGNGAPGGNGGVPENGVGAGNGGAPGNGAGAGNGGGPGNGDTNSSGEERETPPEPESEPEPLPEDTSGLSWYASPDGALVAHDGARDLIALPVGDGRIPPNVPGRERTIEGKDYVVYITKDGRVVR